MHTEKQLREIVMNTQAAASAPARLHPLLAVAAVSVILASAAGVAAVAGWLPATRAVESPLAAIAHNAPQPGGIALPVTQAPVTQAPAPVPAVATVQPEKRATAKPRTVVQPSAVKPVVLSHAEVLEAQRAQQAQQQPVPQVQIAQAPQAPIAQVQVAPKPVCLDCGVIESVRAIEQKGDGSGLGAVAGGVAGAVVGKQMGGGSGNTIMTILGAAGGAYAGHQVEKKVKSVKRYEIAVRLEDGSTRVLTQDSEPAFRNGDRVRLIDGTLRAEG